jgi:FAD/FMN-containing dehydrogenase
MVVPGYSSPKEEGGILVSLAGRNSLTLLDGEDEEEGNKLVRIGAGLKWAQVYDFLEPHGLAVPGGRTASVGVGGFLLHGGISHLSAEYGLGVDSIVEYEVRLLLSGSATPLLTYDR